MKFCVRIFPAKLELKSKIALNQNGLLGTPSDRLKTDLGPRELYRKGVILSLPAHINPTFLSGGKGRPTLTVYLPRRRLLVMIEFCTISF